MGGKISCLAALGLPIIYVYLSQYFFLRSLLWEQPCFSTKAVITACSLSWHAYIQTGYLKKQWEIMRWLCAAQQITLEAAVRWEKQQMCKRFIVPFLQSGNTHWKIQQWLTTLQQRLVDKVILLNRRKTQNYRVRLWFFMLKHLSSSLIKCTFSLHKAERERESSSDLPSLPHDLRHQIIPGTVLLHTRHCTWGLLGRTLSQ